MKHLTNEETKAIAKNLYSVMVAETNDDIGHQGVVIMTMLSVYLCHCHHLRKEGVDGNELIGSFFDIARRDALSLIDKLAEDKEKNDGQHG